MLKIPLRCLLNFDYIDPQLNIPNDALLSADGTDEVAAIDPPSEAVALTCSFLLGLGDAAGSTQMTSILGGVSE